MKFLEPAALQCPYCGEENEITIDISAGSQEYIEDCQVCCKPIEVSVSIENEVMSVFVHSDND